MDKTTIVQGNSAIRAFNDNGVFYGANAVKEIHSYRVMGINANQEYSWNFGTIGDTIIPRTLFGYRSSGLPNNSSLFFRVKINNVLVFEMDLDGKTDKVGKSFFYNFPLLVVAPPQVISLQSSITLDNLMIYAEKAHLNSPVPPQL